MKRKAKKLSVELIKIAIALVLIFPVLIALVASLQSIDEVYRLPYSLSIESPTLEHFMYALQKMNLFGYLKNTLIVILISVPCQIITSLLTAYAFSYFEFPMTANLTRVTIKNYAEKETNKTATSATINIYN